MAKPGDKVEVKTKDKKYTGILMPRPKNVPGDSVIIKLKTGYNIGVSRKKIISMKIIQAVKKGKAVTKKLEKKKNLPDIAILSTGGTISSKVDYKTGGVSPSLTAADFVKSVPELAKIANFDFKQVAQVLSEDIEPNDWIKLANAINNQIKKRKKGIIVTHGTDTMAYTSAAISFMVQNSPIPIVFVGSQRSVDRGSSDAFPNLLTAAYAAAKWDGAETVVCMHESMDDMTNVLIRGTKARKMHTERRDAFKAINALPIARVDYNGNVLKISNYKKRGERKPIFNTKIDKKVAIVYIYPGIESKVIDYYREKKYHGIVLMGTGLGQVPHNLIPALKRCYKAGIPVVMTSQCIFGRVNSRVYETARLLLTEAKVIYAEDMIPETAFVKLMFVLGQTRNIGKVKEMMLNDIAGEITSCTAPRISYLK